MAREMKDSGIEWIGEIPEKWNRCRLKFHCSVLSGFPFDSKNFSLNQGVPLIRIRDITSGYTETRYAGTYNDEYLIKNGDILVGMDGDFNIRIWNGNEALLNQRCCKVTEDEHISHLFLFYCLPFRLQWVNDLTYSTTVKHLSTADITETVLFLPPLPDQHRIATFLDRKCAEIDSVTADTQKTIDEYRALKQSIITEAVTKGVRGERKMKDSGVEWIGDVPEEWKVIKCSRIISGTQNGLTRRDTEKSEGDIVLKLKNIDSNGYIDYSEVNRISLTAKEIETYKLQEGDFLFVRVNGSKSLVGKCAIYHDVGSIVAYNDHIIRVQLNELCSREYFKLYLQSNCGKCEIDLHTSTSAGQFTISGEGLRDMVFVLPPMKEQVEIVEHVSFSLSQIDAIIIDKQQLLTELESYKKSVIYEYVTGKKECGIAVAQVTQAAIVPFYPAAISTKRVRFAQAVLMTKVLDKCHKGMGRVKLEKTMYTIETIIGFDFETEYVRQVAGPLDESLYKCEGIISRVNHWYTVHESQYGVSYKPTKNADKYQSYYYRYFGNYNTEIERIIDIFASYTTEQAEVIATLLAAWNDAIIEGKSFTDTDIVNDVLNNWSEEKKRFSKDVWLRAMDELRKKDLIPKGYGKKTIRRNIK